MTGDYSRDRFDSSKHYSGVFRQQGRVVLESDANEDVKIRQRLSTVSTLDTVGPKGVPETTPDAFMVGFPKEVWWQNWLTVGPGRIYVDGLLVENHGSMPAFNPELGDLYGTQPSFVPKPAPWWKETFLPPGQSPPAPGPSTPSASVPHYATIVAPGSNSGAATAPGPYAGSAAPQPTGSGQGTRPNVYLAYLDVWQREVDALQAPDLLEPALGVDTTTRTQVAWQVRFCALPKIATLAKHGPCDPQHWEQDERWRGLCAPSRGRLTVTTAPVPQAEDPCELPPSGGYRGRENQLYRVEIHDVLDDGTARFKWSRENASVAAAVVEVLDARTLRVASLGRDDILGFSQGDWVEVLSDADELAGDAIRSGFMAQIAALPGERSIDLDRDLPVPVLGWQDSPQQARDHHLRIRRWDQRTGSSKGGLDSDGLIPVAPGGELVTLEAGIEVKFSAIAGDGPAFRTGDYWQFAARTQDSSVERLQDAPPAGIHRHYCPLALVDFGSNTVRDCRVTFRPLTDIQTPSCSIPVEAGTPLTRVFDLLARKAREGVRDFCICLQAGTYELADVTVQQPVSAILGVSAEKILFPFSQPSVTPKYLKLSMPGGTLRIAGCGPATRLHLQQPVALLHWSSVILSNLVIDGGDTPGALGFWDCDSVVLERCDISALTGKGSPIPSVKVLWARRVQISGCYIEAEADEALERYDGQFKKQCTALQKLFSRRGRFRFEECLNTTLDKLSESACNSMQGAVQKLIHDACNGNGGQFSPGELGALSDISNAISGNRTDRNALADALRSLRRAALMACPSVALELTPKSIHDRNNGASESHTYSPGNQRYTLTNSDIIGVLALNGALDKDQHEVDLALLGSVCTTMNGHRNNNEQGSIASDNAFVGTTGDLLIQGNSLVLIAMGGAAVNRLQEYCNGQVRLLGVFERIVLSNNVFRGPASCIIAEDVIVNGNVFAKTADWPGFLECAQGDLRAPLTLPDIGNGHPTQLKFLSNASITPVAVIIARDAAIVGNQGTSGTTRGTEFQNRNNGWELDFLCAITRNKGETLVPGVEMPLWQQVLAAVLQNASLFPIPCCQVRDMLIQDANF